MSKSFMEKLLKGAKVEWKALGEVGDFIRGSGIQKSNFTESGTGCIHYGQIHTHYGTWADETKSFINPEFAARLRKAHTGNLVIATTSEDDDALAKAVAWLGDEEVAVSTDAYIYRHTINPKYMSYFFQTELFRSQKKPYITGTKVRRISGESLAKIQIPIPPLPVQVEIVRILDAFTELTTELTAELASELTARKKQYNYYRDQLLSFEQGEVEWRALGEVAEIRRGTAITEKETTPGNVPVIANAPNPIYFHNKSNRDGETIVIARSGAYAGLVSYWNQAYFLTDAFSIHADAGVIKPKFAYHLLKREQEKIHQMSKGGGVPHVRAKDFEAYQIPIPPLAEQERIVAILDKFDALTNSISEGLPREIRLRQKQYEYYRELLLSFPKAEVGPT
ncbi:MULTISPECIES: restriction endonuclease subunit S [Leptospira]|uniref:restriction endonuclease subunit S n=1 Tax=Leptospira TaxID=171 RepID=UPI0015E2AAAA|nr:MULTISPECIES: restriction endonuclease subunit S [Leptospira]WOT12586.1 restriction endonuclease subunit S [Leptospira interrogans]